MSKKYHYCEDCTRKSVCVDWQTQAATTCSDYDWNKKTLVGFPIGISIAVQKSTRIDRKAFWVVDICGKDFFDSYVQPDGSAGSYIDYSTEAEAETAGNLFLITRGVKTSAGEKDTKAIRKFETGATRDAVEGKLDYTKALCPLVLRRYVQYLDNHRLQPDGSMREFDNWKQGIPRKVYHSSKGRHFFADWLLEEGYEVSDNHGPVDEEEAICGELFNAMGKLHEILKKKFKKSDRSKPVDEGY